MKPSLASIWTSALHELGPAALFRRHRILQRIPRGSGLLFWGKAARATSDRVPLQELGLVLSPDTGEHPLPGPKSFRSGERLLEFFNDLSRRNVRQLTIFLSGGASSLAWLKPRRLDEAELRRRLIRLYRKPLTIQQLNRERAKLCLLKSGGAARLLKLIAPRVQARVFVISDVAPYGVEVVGSGPFTGLPHEVLASNRDLVSEAAKLARGENLLGKKDSYLGSEQKWARELSHSIRRALRSAASGIFIWGGEPQVRLPGNTHGQGGRQCQIAARLLLEFWEEIREGRVEILCASSDGSDGNSGAAAAHLRGSPGSPKSPKSNEKMPALSASLQRQLKKAIAGFDTAPFLRKHGFLIPAFSTGTNVQDLILVRISGKPIA